MKKKNLILMLIAATVALALFISCSKSEKTEQTETTKAAAGETYFCPMHPEVVSDTAGLCPECNMKLVPKNASDEEMMEHYKDSTKAVYTCPMHPEVISDKPGLCPECNMNLELKEEVKDEHGMQMKDSSPVQYTCGMHPQIVTNEPGLCPICNMKLVVKSDVSTESGAIMVDAETSKKMGIATMPASFRPLSKTIRAYGNVTYSEPNLYIVNVKIAGWVEKLYVNETGMKVAKGQPLLEIYSPELVAAQQEYLIAQKTFNSLQSQGNPPNKLLDAAYRKLKNWDISDEQINQLINTQNVTRTLVIKSPFNGVVTLKNVKEGDHVMPGRDLYRVANLSTVWVSAFVYEQDLSLISKGLAADVSSPSFPGSSFESEIIYVAPFLDNNRQAEIRLAVENSKLLLKPNMYAEVNIKRPFGGDNLSVPLSAVIKSGTREVLFVATGKNMFEPREIHTGQTANNGFVEVLHGLNNGENVVVSGQFMLDSESRLNEVIAGMTHSH